MLVGEVEGAHKLWAMKSRLEIPLEHVVSVEAHPAEAQSWWHGWKIIGTDIPGMFAAGLFRFHGKWVFWDVSDPNQVISIKLEEENYEELLIQVEDPDAAAEMIKRTLSSNRE